MTTKPASAPEGRAGSAPRTWPATALLSLSDRSGAVEFARRLAAGGTRLLASGGTALHLEEAGLDVVPIERWTGFTELLSGRVKTLHPHVHAPILARRDVPIDMAELSDRGLEPLDLVAVNLYPFERRAAELDERAATEEIDIGGVAMLRAAAKNHAHVIVVHDPDQYDAILAALERGVTAEERREWAAAAFARTARYDAAIAADLERRASGDRLPRLRVLALERVRTLRYGENPHQVAGLYAQAGAEMALHALREGKELSANNILDLDAAVRLVSRFERPACVIVKHAQPCGAAQAEGPAGAYRAALASDPLSAFGGVVAFNRPLDGETADLLSAQFVECVAAPGFSAEAERAFASKKNLRTVRLDPQDLERTDPNGIRILGDWALIERAGREPAPEWRGVTARQPSEIEWEGLRFAWEVAAAARSNAIALARGAVLVGLGSGQTSRVDAVDVAILKARRVGHDLAGVGMASDGFFPFADNVEHAAAAGIRAIVQPGGSMRDAEVIAACDRLGLAMVFTGRRTFRH